MNWFEKWCLLMFQNQFIRLILSNQDFHVPLIIFFSIINYSHIMQIWYLKPLYFWSLQSWVKTLMVFVNWRGVYLLIYPSGTNSIIGKSLLSDKAFWGKSTDPKKFLTTFLHRPIVLIPKVPAGQEIVCHFSQCHAMVTKILDFYP